MLHAQDKTVRSLLLKGKFGLEKEGLRVTPEGYFAQTPDPFGGDPNIVRDFCENQTEINTSVLESPEEAVECLLGHTNRIHRVLAALPTREVLWPFSNPPYIRNEEDVPIARYYGGQASKTRYREYLSDRYGRYKMTLCGIHVNYSFADELLEADFALSGGTDFRAYKDRLYLDLAEGAAACGWIMTALTAASPLMDGTYVEKGRYGRDAFIGMASVRCSELGYWNYFSPIFHYDSIGAYADSIQRYVDAGLLAAPTELYYPIRLKPRGVNDLDALRTEGVSHIELRMVDLNPLEPAGLHVDDLRFAQLLLVWLASTPRRDFQWKDQVQAVQNFKSAAHYDLKTVKIVAPGGACCDAAEAGLRILEEMKEFYRDFPEPVQRVLGFEEEKFIDPEKRYAWQVRKKYAGRFVTKGLELAEQRQREGVSG